MRIQKTSNSVALDGKVVNTYSTSNSDTYSCEYINKTHDCITGYSSATTIPSNDSDVNLNLTSSIGGGNKLTLDSNGIKIGSGVSKVKISGQLSCQASGTGETVSIILAVYKNGTLFCSIADEFSKIDVYYFATINLSPRVIEVQSGDILTLKARNNKVNLLVANNDWSYAYLTVETV